jgi:DNA-binding NtrC family response regulator
MNILLIEDNDALRNLYCNFLELESHTVTKAALLAEARQIVNHTRFDCIFSDLGLHDATVKQVLEFLRMQKAASQIAVISGDVEYQTLVARYGFCFYVKPVKRDVLLEALTKSCNQDLTTS